LRLRGMRRMSDEEDHDADHTFMSSHES
jgi:hypothetical protein